MSGISQPVKRLVKENIFSGSSTSVNLSGQLQEGDVLYIGGVDASGFDTILATCYYPGADIDQAIAVKQNLSTYNLRTYACNINSSTSVLKVNRFEQTVSSVTPMNITSVDRLRYK